MKKKFFIRKSTSCACMALLLSAFVVSGCHKTNDDVPIPPEIPKVEPTYAIHGVVTGLVNGQAVADATVKISGTAEAEARTNAQGEFSVQNLKKQGAYQIEVSKTGFLTATANATVSSALVDVSIRLPNEPVKATAKPTEESVLSLPKEENTVATEVKLQIPVGAVTEIKEIKVTQVVDAAPPAITESKAVPLIILNYQPDGTTFEVPCPLEITNPIGEYSFQDPALEWLNPQTNKWEKQPQTVDYGDGAYKTTITHFSSYKIAIPDVIGEVKKANENLPEIASTDNLNGRQDVKVESVPYTYKRGVVYITKPEDAAQSAGITDPKVIAFIKSSINSQVQVNDSYADVNAQYPVNVTIPKGVRMDVKGTQIFTTTTYNFKFVKGNSLVTATVVTQNAGSVSITTSFYTKEHTGGGVN